MPDFDEFLIEKVTPVVNKVVEICNDLNGAIDDIKDAAAIVVGAFKVDVDLDDAKEVDAVILALQKADGSFPTKAEVEALDAKATAADKALTKARKALASAMEKKYVALEVVEDKLAVKEGGEAPAQLEAFNTALGELRGAAGEMKVVLVVKSAGVGGIETVHAGLEVPIFASEDADTPTWEPVGVLHMAKSNCAKALFGAEQSVASSLGNLAKAVKDARELKVEIDFELKRKKVVVKMTDPEGDKPEDLDDKKAAVKKAAATANQQLFKLFKSARNANGDVGLAKAVVILIESFKKRAATLAKDNSKQLTEIIKFDPKFDFGLECVEFDIGMKIALADWEDMNGKETLNKLLPAPAKLVYKAIEDLVENVKEKMIPNFKELAELVEELVGSVEEVFADPVDKIKAAFGETDDMFAIPKAAANAALNAKTVAMEPIKIISTFKDSIVRVKDEFGAAFEEAKTLLAAE